MLTCQKCGRKYPSKYHFVTADTCNSCFTDLPKAEQDNLLASAESLEKEEAAVRSIDGHTLKCPVCQHGKFWARHTLMNTPGMTFWGIEWANRQAENFVCNSCGYVMWFLR